MASNLSAIEKHLECSICCETINEPKILESCHHVFCKKCISDLVKSKKGKKSFPCPECRVICKLPSGGVDGLKDDSMVANLVRLLNFPEDTGKCFLCAGQDLAVSVCDFCDLDLCKNCSRQHHQEDLDHVIYDLCETHGKRMKRYCYKCEKIICVTCYQQEHSAEDHATGPYGDFASNNLTSLTKKIDEISYRANSTETRIEKVELQITQARSKKKAIIDESNAAIESLTLETNDVRMEIEALQIRLHQLESERETKTEDMESQIKVIDSESYVYDAEAYMAIVTEKIADLVSTRTQLTRLAGESVLGDAHYEEVLESKCRLEDAESAFICLKQKVDEMERSCLSSDLFIMVIFVLVLYLVF
ncbi:probable E3 ubiquitin-protein ligase MID2 [Lineus longissimus]|uniref:probable E3 ubiquitin-protein ligase MID2 n=1 Tax=Lineus longissimus TaxID=88925 RepID=UPI002B4CC8CD